MKGNLTDAEREIADKAYREGVQELQRCRLLSLGGRMTNKEVNPEYNYEICRALDCGESYDRCENNGMCPLYYRVEEYIYRVLTEDRERIIEEIETLQLDELDENWLKHFIRGKEGCPLKVE